MNYSLCGNFLEKLDAIYIDYSVIFLSEILVEIYRSRAQRHTEEMLDVRLILVWWTFWQMEKPHFCHHLSLHSSGALSQLLGLFQVVKFYLII